MVECSQSTRPGPDELADSAGYWAGWAREVGSNYHGTGNLMARGREGMAQREQERMRQERQEQKRIRREATASEAQSPDLADEARLMDEFRLLSERHAGGMLSEAAYATERHRIFVELGMERSEG